LRIDRYVAHALVLLVAALLAGYNLAGSLRAAQSSFDAQAANVGDVSMGRDTTIIRPVSVPIAALPSRAPILYTVKAGDTLDGIATNLGVPFREITWSNPGLKLPLEAGKVLRIPPVPGFVVTVKPNDSLATLAAAYGGDPAAIIDFNRIRGPLTAGSMLVVPVDPTVGPNLSSGVPADPIKPGQFVCPILGSSIIQGFGPSSFALDSPYGGYLHFHQGVDIVGAYGTPIDAAAGGKVTAVGYLGGFGLRVEVTDSYGLVEIYAHMSDTSMAVGQLVQQGDKLGLVGSTGNSIGPHLHFQLEIGGVPTEPRPLVGCAG